MAQYDDDALRKLDDVLTRMQRTMRVHSLVKDYGLTTSQFFILKYLEQSGIAKASEIARMAGLSPGAVTQVCDELVRLGLVERVRSDTDRRVVNVSLTQAGIAHLERIRNDRTKRLFNIVTQLDAQDVESLIRILNRVVDLVESTENIGG